MVESNRCASWGHAGGSARQLRCSPGKREEAQERGQQGGLSCAGGSCHREPAAGSGLGGDSGKDVGPRATRPRGPPVRSRAYRRSGPADRAAVGVLYRGPSSIGARTPAGRRTRPGRRAAPGLPHRGDDAAKASTRASWIKDDDGDRRRLTAPLRASGAAEDTRPTAAGEQARTVTAWPRPSAHADRWAERWRRGRPGFAPSTGRYAVRMEFRAGVQDCCHAMEYDGAEMLFGAGSLPVGGQRQCRGNHDAQKRCRAHGGQGGGPATIAKTAAAAHTYCSDGWQHDAGQEIPKGVDVVHDRAQHVAALEEAPQGQCPAAQRPPQWAAEAGHGGEDGVMGQQPFGVPEARPADAEEPHADDRCEQVAGWAAARWHG